ncbi:hypothetical protein ECEC1847_3804, partial [Escherichia coli EC1847]
LYEGIRSFLYPVAISYLTV